MVTCEYECKKTTTSCPLCTGHCSGQCPRCGKCDRDNNRQCPLFWYSSIPTTRMSPEEIERLPGYEPIDNSYHTPPATAFSKKK